MSSVPATPTIAAPILPYVAARQMDLDGLPEGAAQYGLAGLRLLAICRELQRLNVERGRDNFILAARVAAELIGLGGERGRMNAHRLLTDAFVRKEWIEVIERGDPRRGGTANVYRYRGDGPPEENGGRRCTRRPPNGT